MCVEGLIEQPVREGHPGLDKEKKGESLIGIIQGIVILFVAFSLAFLYIRPFWWWRRFFRGGKNILRESCIILKTFFFFLPFSSPYEMDKDNPGWFPSIKKHKNISQASLMYGIRL